MHNLIIQASQYAIYCVVIFVLLLTEVANLRVTVRNRGVNFLLQASTFYGYVKDYQLILQVLVGDIIINFDITICILFHTSQEM